MTRAQQAPSGGAGRRAGVSDSGGPLTPTTRTLQIGERVSVLIPKGTALGAFMDRQGFARRRRVTVIDPQDGRFPLVRFSPGARAPMSARVEQARKAMARRMPEGEEPGRDTDAVPVDELPLNSLATALTARMRSLEASAWNKHTWTDRSGREHSSSHFFNATAWAVSGRIKLLFVSYQGTVTVDADQARDYLEWLRAGNRGSFFSAQHAGAIRKSKVELAAAQSEEARAVAYKRARSHSRWAESADVLSAIFIPEGAQTARADEVGEGDKVFWQGKWRTVKRNSEYVPVQPEDAHGLAADIQDAVRRGDYAMAADLAHNMERTANELADGRDFERTLRFAGNVAVTVLPETTVAVRKAKGA